MTHEEAKQRLVFATDDEQGALIQLRLGQDPGSDQMMQLRLALRILWHHWKSAVAIPFDIARSAGMILHFKEEASQNLRASGSTVRERLTDYELPDLAMGAFELLCGQVAEQWTIRRMDLGE